MLFFPIVWSKCAEHLVPESCSPPQGSNLGTPHLSLTLDHSNSACFINRGLEDSDSWTIWHTQILNFGLKLRFRISGHPALPITNRRQFLTDTSFGEGLPDICSLCWLLRIKQGRWVFRVTENQVLNKFYLYLSCVHLGNSKQDELRLRKIYFDSRQWLTGLRCKKFS